MQEFGKLASKILANRMGSILLKHPLTPAQRAFLKDGSTSQCLRTALNVLEDFKECKRHKPKSQLFMLAYDQSKAFDSVQAYTIQASLERFNLPKQFIEYVLSNLKEAKSCFKTFYGPTDDIAVQASVRQGDPLSPLIYICITDALHEGLRRNPLFDNCKTGYTFSNDTKLTISSTGYADDTMTYVASWQDQWKMHEWVREFCWVHHFKLNAVKCKYFISDYQGHDDPRWLLSVDGSEKITPLPPSKQFRYLGLWISMDLSWSMQIQILNKMVMDWRWRAVSAKVDPAQLKASITEYLVPKMDLGLSFANVTQKMCDAWLSTIIHTLCRGFNTVSSLNKSAFCVLSGIPDIFLRMQTSRITDIVVNLNTRNGLHGLTSRARFCQLMGLQSANFDAALKAFRMVNLKTTANNRISGTLKFMQQHQIELILGEESIVGDVKPLALTQAISKTLRDSPSNSFFAYTDGSTTPNGRSPNSGCSVVLTDHEDKHFWSGGLVVRSDGNNFIPELTAASCVLKALPKTSF